MLFLRHSANNSEQLATISYFNSANMNESWNEISKLSSDWINCVDGSLNCALNCTITLFKNLKNSNIVHKNQHKFIYSFFSCRRRYAFTSSVRSGYLTACHVNVVITSSSRNYSLWMPTYSRQGLANPVICMLRPVPGYSVARVFSHSESGSWGVLLSSSDVNLGSTVIWLQVIKKNQN